MYEDTAGLTVGDPIVKTGKPLALELGPGILNNIFDGIQRPLERILDIAQSVFVPRGVDVPALDQEKKWTFQPASIRKGDLVSGGDVIGVVRENGLFKEHKIISMMVRLASDGDGPTSLHAHRALRNLAYHGECKVQACPFRGIM